MFYVNSRCRFHIEYLLMSNRQFRKPVTPLPKVTFGNRLEFHTVGYGLHCCLVHAA